MNITITSLLLPLSYQGWYSQMSITWFKSCWQDVLPVFHCLFSVHILGLFNCSIGHMFMLMLNEFIIWQVSREQILTAGLGFFFRIMLWYLSFQYDELERNQYKVSLTHFIVCKNKINKLSFALLQQTVWPQTSTSQDKCRRSWQTLNLWNTGTGALKIREVDLEP